MRGKVIVLLSSVSPSLFFIVIRIAEALGQNRVMRANIYYVP